MNGLTTRMALAFLKLQAGSTIAVVGAAGAVGGYRVQLAKGDGLRVSADAAPKHEQLVKKLGADVILARGDAFPHLVRAEVPGGVDALVDTAGLAESSARAVRDGGHVATAAGASQKTAERGISIHRLRAAIRARPRQPRAPAPTRRRGTRLLAGRPRPARRASRRRTPADGSSRPARTSGAHLLTTRPAIHWPPPYPLPTARRSPGRMTSTGPPRRWHRPMPSVTKTVWLRGWRCQCVRAPGMKCTRLALTREGSGAAATASM